MSNEINIQNVINHWISISDKDYETMIHLVETKDFHWSLFIGHLVLKRF